jgi:tetratricopeptide (TPR) repeat protein
MRNVVITLVAALSLGMAQDKPAESKPAQKVAKDQKEADLINSLPKEADPAKRLQTLDTWTKDYPQTAFDDVRDQVYLATYMQLRRPQDVFNRAKEIVGKHPNDFTALYALIAYVQYLNNGNPQSGDLDTAEQACHHVIDNADAVFADSNKPADIPAANWPALRKSTPPMAQKTIGYIYFQRKDWPRAETELTKALQEDPTQAQASFMLATALFSQREKDPKKQPPSIFEFARAASYDGPNSLPAATRQTILASVTKTYAAYHGSNDGLNDVLALAKTNALPPADFNIKSTADLAQDKAAAQAAADAANPSLALWRNIREQLTGEGGQAYWDGTVKDAGLPGGAGGVNKFKGTIVSMTPENRPKEIVLAVEKPGVADVTLKFEAALPGKMDPGETLEFEGQAKEYSKDPYMLTIATDKDKIVGWTGKNPAAPRKKKAQ